MVYLPTSPLPADLPENWSTGQIIAPTGAEAGLSQQHGYNYQSAQINATQRAVNAINEAFVRLDDIDCGLFTDEEPLALHNNTATAHPRVILDGNATASASTANTLEEHLDDPSAHWNLSVDGNQT